MSSQVKQITGADFACSYVSSAKAGFSAVVASQLQLDELLDHLFTALHATIMAGTRTICRDDFMVRLRLVPQSSQVTLTTVPAGLPGATASSAQDSRSTSHVELVCAVQKDIKTPSDMLHICKSPVSASETFKGALQNMQKLLADMLAEYDKATTAQRPAPLALQGLPLDVREGRSRVVGFIYRTEADSHKMKDEQRKTQAAEKREEEFKSDAGGEDESLTVEEGWTLEDDEGLWGCKVDNEMAWQTFCALLFTDEALQVRPVTLCLELLAEAGGKYVYIYMYICMYKYLCIRINLHIDICIYKKNCVIYTYVYIYMRYV